MNEIPTAVGPLLVFAAQCHPGLVRQENQDSVLRARVALGDLLIVADGIGGYKGGATASRMVVEEFERHLAALPPGFSPERAIREASAQANSAILQAAAAPDSPYRQMGSTVVVALLQAGGSAASPAVAWVGNVGDSRAYLVRQGRLSCLTHDHSVVQTLLRRNLITPEEALRHPDASVLTRSLGHQPEVEIDIAPFPLEPGDTLLLCSDGLWGFVAEQLIEQAAADPTLSLEAASAALLDLALAAGAPDNVGIQMARLEPAHAALPASIA